MSKPLNFGLGVFLLICLGLVNCAEKGGKMARTFGKLPDGTEIKLYTIANTKGLSAEIINYGAIVVALKVPDRKGAMADVILGFDDLDSYVRDNSFQGAIVGRYGNRIAQGLFILEGKTYQLSINDGNNHLHGGSRGFFKQFWRCEKATRNSLRLSYVSPDGEEGYPGEVKIKVTYSITENNELKIEYWAQTNKTTILNPTSHCYFNLTGNPENMILEHELQINADNFTPVDSSLIPTGEIRPVAGTPFDFRESKPIGKDINVPDEQMQFGRGYDHNWVLNGYPGQVRPVASLYEPQSGRLMEVLTDQPGIQFYSGNFLDSTLIGKGGVHYNYRTALCLETQAFPDSPNKPNFPSVVLSPGETYRHTTIYRFAVK
jgi:aldose 1-epimerase